CTGGTSASCLPPTSIVASGEEMTSILVFLTGKSVIVPLILGTGAGSRFPASEGDQAGKGLLGAGRLQRPTGAVAGTGHRRKRHESRRAPGGRTRPDRAWADAAGKGRGTDRSGAASPRRLPAVGSPVLPAVRRPVPPRQGGRRVLPSAQAAGHPRTGRA